MENETIKLEHMQKVLQEQSVRQRMKILLDAGYSYECIQKCYWLIADGTILIKIKSIIAEKITDEECQDIVQNYKKRRNPDHPYVKWTKEKDQIILLCYEKYELIKERFTEDVTIGAIKNRLYQLLRKKK